MVMISCSIMISSAKLCVASYRHPKNMGQAIALMSAVRFGLAEPGAAGGRQRPVLPG